MPDLGFTSCAGKVALRETVSGAGNVRSKQAAKARAQSAGWTRRRLADATMDPVVANVPAGDPEQDEMEELERDRPDGIAERRAGDARTDAPVTASQLRGNILANLPIPGQHVHRWESLRFVTPKRMCRGSTCTS